LRRDAIEMGTSVLAEMEAEAERRFPAESGGVLLGYCYPSRHEPIRVISQIGPGPNARHRPHRFDPDGHWQDEEISKAYEASGRKLSYLGDWHSHPRGGGRPSKLDRSTARSIARCEEARVRHPLLVILYGEPQEWRLAPHRYRRYRLSPVRVEVMSLRENG
jgi:integrative and conjugative element protein (TIGR02256 family)